MGKCKHETVASRFSFNNTDLSHIGNEIPFCRTVSLLLKLFFIYVRAVFIASSKSASELKTFLIYLSPSPVCGICTFSEELIIIVRILKITYYL